MSVTLLSYNLSVTVLSYNFSVTLLSYSLSVTMLSYNLSVTMLSYNLSVTLLSYNLTVTLLSYNLTVTQQRQLLLHHEIFGATRSVILKPLKTQANKQMKPIEISLFPLLPVPNKPYGFCGR